MRVPPHAGGTGELEGGFEWELEGGFEGGLKGTPVVLITFLEHLLG